MEIIVLPDADAVGRHAASLIADTIAGKDEPVVGVATGSSPLATYRELAELVRGGLDVSRTTAFALDEYVGLAPDHPQSYREFMRAHLFSKVNIAGSNIQFPDGLARDIPAHCADYEAAIQRAGGIDLQLLGIGRDGHIGFNEPTSSLASRTRIKTLTPQTVKDNSRFFGSADAVPRHVITMGVGTIMDARCCLLLATGEGKAGAVAGMAEGAITADLPASVLQMHPVCKLVVDEAAASKLRRAEYYRWIYENKPDWQRV